MFFLVLSTLVFVIVISSYKKYNNYMSYSIEDTDNLRVTTSPSPYLSSGSKTNKTDTFLQIPGRLNSASIYQPTSTPLITPTPLNTSGNEGLTVVMENAETLGIYSSIPGGKLLVTRFVKKDWGTWNIQGWHISKDNLIPSKKAYLLAGGSSDWEYVFRVTDKINSSYEFSGGSHGNEMLTSFVLLDSDSNRELNLKTREKIKVSRLLIIEKTSLTINNNQSDKYADVKRTYMISPSEITLYTDFDFTSDIYMGTSYVCMFPSNKSFGNNIRFMDSGNVYKTPKSGTTLSTDNFENYIGKEKTMSVEIWGDSNPTYVFEAGIGNEEMVENFNNELKVFYWDLNKQSNKLYFSKYDNKDFKLIKSGTKWSNSAYWKFKISTGKK